VEILKIFREEVAVSSAATGLLLLSLGLSPVSRFFVVDILFSLAYLILIVVLLTIITVNIIIISSYTPQKHTRARRAPLLSS
jgi:hypothetical protein